MVWRFQLFVRRLFDYLVHIPSRLLRFIKWLLWITPIYGKHKFIRWLSGSFLLAVDITPVPFFIECILDFIKIKTRLLNEKEKLIITSVFDTGLPIHLITLDPDSFFAKSKKLIGYVTFHTVNFDKSIPDNSFVHELVHIWQYRKYGSAYISEAIWAQRWGGGYDYGGLGPLKTYSDTIGLSAFNFEQQANIIEEYFRWKYNLPLQWVEPDSELGQLLNKYCEEVRV